MASAALLDDTEEKCNGTKLARLLIDGGTATLRHAFDSIHAPADLQSVLYSNQHLLNNLQKKRVLNSSQWDKLYPPSGAAPDSKTFDITLLFILLRDICGLTTPATGWNDLPHAADMSREANLARIKYYRNQVYGHVSSTEVSNADFEQYWNDISGAMIALGTDKLSIDSLKVSAIGQTKYLDLLSKWKREDDEVKEMIQNLGEKIDKVLKHTPLVETLSQCDFTLHTNFLVNQFQEGTRVSVLDKIKDLYSNPELQSKALVITALPGVGKSVLAAVACKLAKEKGCLGACHFLEHNNSQRSNPRVVIESIARHLCESIEGFKESLNRRLLPLNKNVRKELDEMNLETLITVLLEEPLGNVESGKSLDKIFVVVIDALDECEPRMRDEFVSALLSKLRHMPKWIKFVLTSRPTRKLLIDLLHVAVVKIDANDTNNTEDIRLYLSNQLQLIYPDKCHEKREAAVATLATKSSGIFLYAHFVVEEARNRDLSLAETSELFPNGISSVYTDYLARLRTELNIAEDKFFNFLEAIAAAQAPLPESLVIKILGLNLVSRQGKTKALKTLKCLSLLFPIETKHVAAFHKSLVDWLIKDDEKEEGFEFTVKVEDGHLVLTECCLEVLRAIKNNRSFPSELNDSEKFALTFGFNHMLKAGGYKEQLRECVHDLELLSEMWVARGRSMLNELMDITKYYSVFVEDFSLENTFSWLLNRTFISAANYPHIFLQLAAYLPNSTKSKSRAVSLLSSPKYRKYLWVEKHEYYSADQDLVVVSACSSDHVVACFLGSHHSCYLVTLSRQNAEQLAGVVLDQGSARDFDAKIHISPCDKYIVSYNHREFQNIEVRDLKTLQVQRSFEVESGNHILSCCFVTTNKLAFGCDDGTVRVWDVESGALETTLRCTFGRPDICVASPAGELLTVEGGSVVLWRSLTPVFVSEKLVSRVLETIPPAKPVTFSPDGGLLACWCRGSSGPHVIKVFDVTTWQLLNNFPDEGRYVFHFSFVDDDHLLIMRLCDTDLPVKVMAVRNCSTPEHPVESNFKLIYHHSAVPFDLIPTNRKTLYELVFHNVS